MIDDPGDVAVVGLGNMGAPVAARVARRGPTAGLDADEERTRRVCREIGARAVTDVQELAPASVVVLCLPHPDVSRSMVRRLAPVLREGSVIVETSTVGPRHVDEWAAIAGAHGVAVVDAAIAAGVAGMSAGTAELLVGGEPEEVARARPALDAMSSSVRIVGGRGAGATLKVINNAVAHAVMVVLVEAAALARAGGIDRSHLTGLLTGTSAGLTRPLEHRLLDRIAAGDYAGGMPTEAALKDSALVRELAHQLSVPLFAIDGSHGVYEMAVADGLGRQDYAAIARLWEKWLATDMSERSDGSTHDG